MEYYVKKQRSSQSPYQYTLGNMMDKIPNAILLQYVYPYITGETSFKNYAKKTTEIRKIKKKYSDLRKTDQRDRNLNFEISKIKHSYIIFPKNDNESTYFVRLYFGIRHNEIIMTPFGKGERIETFVFHGYHYKIHYHDNICNGLRHGFSTETVSINNFHAMFSIQPKINRVYSGFYDRDIFHGIGKFYQVKQNFNDIKMHLSDLYVMDGIYTINKSRISGSSMVKFSIMDDFLEVHDNYSCYFGNFQELFYDNGNIITSRDICKGVERYISLSGEGYNAINSKYGETVGHENYNKYILRTLRDICLIDNNYLLNNYNQKTFKNSFSCLWLPQYVGEFRNSMKNGNGIEFSYMMILTNGPDNLINNKSCKHLISIYDGEFHNNDKIGIGSLELYMIDETTLQDTINLEQSRLYRLLREVTSLWCFILNNDSDFMNKMKEKFENVINHLIHDIINEIKTYTKIAYYSGRFDKCFAMDGELIHYHDEQEDQYKGYWGNGYLNINIDQSKYHEIETHEDELNVGKKRKLSMA